MNKEPEKPRLFSSKKALKPLLSNLELLRGTVDRKYYGTPTGDLWWRACSESVDVRYLKDPLGLLKVLNCYVAVGPKPRALKQLVG